MLLVPRYVHGHRGYQTRYPQRNQPVRCSTAWMGQLQSNTEIRFWLLCSLFLSPLQPDHSSLAERVSSPRHTYEFHRTEVQVLLAFGCSLSTTQHARVEGAMPAVYHQKPPREWYSQGHTPHHTVEACFTHRNQRLSFSPEMRRLVLKQNNALCSRCEWDAPSHVVASVVMAVVAGVVEVDIVVLLLLLKSSSMISRETAQGYTLEMPLMKFRKRFTRAITHVSPRGPSQRQTVK